jgi:hypothetical protein
LFIFCGRRKVPVSVTVWPGRTDLGVALNKIAGLAPVLPAGRTVGVVLPTGWEM